METRTRTLYKSLTYRALGFVITTLAAWLLTRKLNVAATIGITDTVLKIGAFYFHERMWLKINYGRLTAPDYDI